MGEVIDDRCKEAEGVMLIILNTSILPVMRDYSRVTLDL